MPRWNFATIRKGETGGLGRLNLSITADASQQSLQVHIGKAQDIGAAPGAENGKGLNVEVRVQIRPHADDLAVYNVSLLCTFPCCAVLCTSSLPFHHLLPHMHTCVPSFFLSFPRLFCILGTTLHFLVYYQSSRQVYYSVLKVYHANARSIF